MSSTSHWRLRDWGLIALLLAFAGLLLAVGVAEQDAELVAGGLVIALTVLGGAALYRRLTAWIDRVFGGG
jgi:hypothetical protein